MLITNDKERRRLKLDRSEQAPSPQAFARSLVSSDIHPWVRRTTGEVHPCDPEAEKVKRVLTTSFAAADLIRHLREGFSGNKQ
jgi:hypothetical protein